MILPIPAKDRIDLQQQGFLGLWPELRIQCYLKCEHMLRAVKGPAMQLSYFPDCR